MADKYLKVGTSGFPEEKELIITSAGAGDSGKGIALDAGGKLDPTLFPAGLGTDSKSLIAGESLAARDLVYIDGATGKVLKADANAIAKAAVGFTLASAVLDGAVTVYFEGTITGLSALTPGAMYFLSATAVGAATLTVPSGAADIVQHIGRAISATEINFEPGEPILRV